MLLREQQAAEAEERLGAVPPAEDPKLQLLHMLEWEPPGAKYLYDEDTGMLRGAGECGTRVDVTDGGVERARGGG